MKIIILIILIQIVLVDFSLSQVIPDSAGFDVLKWNCDEFELIETLELEDYQRIRENDSVTVIRNEDEANGVYFKLSYQFVHHHLKEINEYYAIDTLSKNYRKFIDFIIVEQFKYGEKFGLPEMFIGTLDGAEVNRNVYRNKYLEIQFMNWDDGGLRMINKIIRLNEGL